MHKIMLKQLSQHILDLRQFRFNQRISYFQQQLMCNEISADILTTKLKLITEDGYNIDRSTSGETKEDTEQLILPFKPNIDIKS